MYESYWNFTEKPFENSAGAKFFYPSSKHEEALMRMIYVVREHKGGALLIGSYGTGKTTLANALLTELENSRNYATVFITNPLISAMDFLKTIVSRLGVAFTSDISPLEVKNLLESVLRKNFDNDKHSVIIIDEAHLIESKETWEELRLLLNFKFNERFLLSLILMGQLELSHSIENMQQLKQRLSMRYHLKPLTDVETSAYINHRLNIVGSNESIFTKEAVNKIFSYSNGNPRDINNICDMALLVGYGKKIKKIDKDTVEEVFKDLEESFDDKNNRSG